MKVVSKQRVEGNGRRMVILEGTYYRYRLYFLYVRKSCVHETYRSYKFKKKFVKKKENCRQIRASNSWKMYFHRYQVSVEEILEFFFTALLFLDFNNFFIFVILQYLYANFRFRWFSRERSRLLYFPIFSRLINTKGN